MAEAHQARMQNVVEEMVQSLERDHIRKMQAGVLSVETWRVDVAPCFYRSDLCSILYPSHVLSVCSRCRVACSAAVQSAVIAPQTPCLRCISASRGVTLLWPKLRDWSLQSWRSSRWATWYPLSPLCNLLPPCQHLSVWQATCNHCSSIISATTFYFNVAFKIEAFTFIRHATDYDQFNPRGVPEVCVIVNTLNRFM